MKDILFIIGGLALAAVTLFFGGLFGLATAAAVSDYVDQSTELFVAGCVGAFFVLTINCVHWINNAGEDRGE